jgi:hypothetical protein
VVQKNQTIQVSQKTLICEFGFNKIGMPFNPNIHNRQSIRLKGYDYSQPGWYFITICVQNRWCLFGNVIDGEMVLNDAGIMVENEWLKLPLRFSNIKLHEYVVMPNHFHSIIEIVGNENDRGNKNVLNNENVGNNENHRRQPQTGELPTGQPPTGQPKTVGDMVVAFQSIVIVEYIRG